MLDLDHKSHIGNIDAALSELGRRLVREKNHFHKTEPYVSRTKPHDLISGVMVDYYKAKNIMEDASVYTHIYIDPKSGMLIINSFKEL